MLTLDHDGQAADFASLYLAYRAPLYRFCLARTHDPVRAEDLMQEAFTKAFASLSRFEPGRPFWPWLATIAARECYDEHRRDLLATTRTDDAAQATRAAPVDATVHAVVQAAAHEDITRRLRGLPDRQRTALLLFAVDGWTYAQIADQFGATVGTIKALISRARAQLRKAGGPWAAGAAAGVRSARRRLRGLMEAVGSAAHPWASALSAVVHSGLGSVLVAATVVATAASGWALPDATANAAQVRADRPRTEPAPSAAPVAAPSGPALAARPTSGSAEAPRPAVQRPATAVGEQLVHETTEAIPSPWGTDESQFSEMETVTASPTYEQDRTVFVTRWQAPYPNAARLLVSRDGGASWQRPRALGFGGARRLLFPPAYPSDPRIFAFNLRGLQVTHDGGETFDTVLPLPGYVGPRTAVLSPRFDQGDPTILFVDNYRLFSYNIQLGTVRPVVEASTAWGLVEDVAFSARYAEEPYVFVVGRRASGEPLREDAGHRRLDPVERTISRCAVDPALGGQGVGPLASAPLVLECTTTTITAPGSPVVSLAMSAQLPVGTLFVPDGHALLTSYDGGRTVERSGRWQPFGGELISHVDAVAGGGNALLVSQRTYLSGRPPLVRSPDGGRTWTSVFLDIEGFETGASGIATTPTGRVIARGYQGGTACSDDGGRTWLHCVPDRG